MIQKKKEKKVEKPIEEKKYSIVSKLRQVLCSGIMFNKAPTILTEKEMTQEIFKNENLEIVEVK